VSKPFHDRRDRAAPDGRVWFTGWDRDAGGLVIYSSRYPDVGVTVDADSIMAYVAEQVAPYKKVRRVEFIEAVPKAASGKILRRQLRAREHVTG
jgi:acyl-CoA synthetase (AMP-forming)/AMP-acid ligase II